MMPRCANQFSSRKQRWSVGLPRLAILPLLLLFLCGCPFQPGGNVPAGTDPNDKTDPRSGEVAPSLVDATPLQFSGASDATSITGTIDSLSDVFVYDLGVLKPGDRLVADIRRASGNLDPTAAIFNSQEHLVAFSDDRASDGSNLNPYFDLIVPGDEGNYYLGIIAYPGSATSGDFTADIQVERSAGTPRGEAQIVFLDWDGGTDVLVENVGLFNLPPFSATDVGLAASETAALKDRVQAIIEERYADLNFIVLNSDDHAVPSEPHSTVYFGGQSFQAFAIAQQIDTFNEDPTDDAIVFTRSFSGAFSRTPTFEQLAQALANTVAHEVGHLLGLVHTHECGSLMDTTCSNDRQLSPQSFQEADLDESVFPFGVQDAQEILGWVLGFVGLE